MLETKLLTVKNRHCKNGLDISPLLVIVCNYYKVQLHYADAQQSRFVVKI